MFHYPFLGVFSVGASETLLLLFETSRNSARLGLPNLKHPETPRVTSEIWMSVALQRIFFDSAVTNRWILSLNRLSQKTGQVQMPAFRSVVAQTFLKLA